MGLSFEIYLTNSSCSLDLITCEVIASSRDVSSGKRTKKGLLESFAVSAIDLFLTLASKSSVIRVNISSNWADCMYSFVAVDKFGGRVAARSWSTKSSPTMSKSETCRWN